MTDTIAVSPDQYRRLCEYAEQLGKTVDEAIYEAVEELMTMPEAEKQEILGRQNQ